MQARMRTQATHVRIRITLPRGQQMQAFFARHPTQTSQDIHIKEFPLIHECVFASKRLAKHAEIYVIWSVVN